MSTTAATAPSWQRMPAVPRPLQRLFDSVPLITYEANELPARAQSYTLSQKPTLFVFSSEEDARHGLPSFNPGCLKWQTFLKLSSLEFNIVPSTNHASPTGSLPFLLPPRDSYSSSSSSSTTTTTTTTPTKPIPSSKLHDYALAHKKSPSSPFSSQPPSPPQPQQASSLLRQEAYQSLVDVSLRNAFLYTLYLHPRHAALLDRLYITPSTHSSWIRATLRHQLRRAAEAEILKSTHSASGGGSGGGGGLGVVNEGEVYRCAGEALEALAEVLGRQSEKGDDDGRGWFFGESEPGLFDVGVFAYTFLMVKFFSSSSGGGGEEEGQEEIHGAGKGGIYPLLGDMVRKAGDGELIRHMNRVLELTWPDLVAGTVEKV